MADATDRAVTQPAHGAARPDWTAIGVFWLTAALWSWLAARHAALPPVIAPGVRIDASLVAGFGPAVGAVIASRVRPQRDGGPVRFWTHPRSWAMLALMAPVITLGLAGMADGRASPPVAGAIFAASVVLYSIGEEIGWRGWLRNALHGQAEWRIVAVTAALWYAWHWTFLADQLRDPRFGIGFALGCLAASFGLNRAVQRTGSSAIAASWHGAAKAMGGPIQIAAMIALLVVATWRARRSSAG